MSLSEILTVPTSQIPLSPTRGFEMKCTLSLTVSVIIVAVVVAVVLWKSSVSEPNNM